MKNKLFIAFILLALAAILTGVAAADELYSFELTEAEKIEEHDHNWYLNISVPQISGMRDKKAEAELNNNFLKTRDQLVEEYKSDSEYMLEEYEEDELPHFGYEYSWEKIVDTENYFVFRTQIFYAAGSSMTINEYWTLDKRTGDQVEIRDLADNVRLEEILYQIMEAMVKENETEEVFWLDEENLIISFANIEEYHHWYVNENGNLVITFDKYEIAPGAFGESRFEIVGDKAVLMKDKKYSFDLYVGDEVKINEPNWFLNLHIPHIGGLADPDVEEQMNQHFQQTADNIQKEFETTVATAIEYADEADGPHFGYEYSYEIIADTDDYFTFKTISYFAAGSSMTTCEFWTLDKNTGLPLKWEEVVPANSMPAIRDQIFAKMTAANEAGEGMYYTDDDSLNFALMNVPNYNHWYLNADGELVIQFDKYEVAVGAQGNPEFVIDRSAL